MVNQRYHTKFMKTRKYEMRIQTSKTNSKSVKKHYILDCFTNYEIFRLLLTGSKALQSNDYSIKHTRSIYISGSWSTQMANQNAHAMVNQRHTQ